MPRFFNSRDDYFISTSCKVLYTTLKSQEYLSELSNIQFWLNMWINSFIGRKYRSYLLVRNPYDRMVSCFSDKFRRSPKIRKVHEGWQSSQTLAFPFIGIKGDEGFEEIRARLLSFQFDDFVRMLPMVYKKEGHYFPQYFMLHPRIKKRIAAPKICFKRIYKIESELAEAAKDLNLDFSIKTQQSEHGSSQDYYDLQTLSIVNRIYAKDFEFGYSRHNSLNK